MRRAALSALAALGICGLLPAAAHGAFGFNHFEVAFEQQGGAPATEAGTHPFALTSTFGTNTGEEEGFVFVEGQLRDFLLDQPPGLVADTTAYPECSSLQFLEESCPLNSVVGITASSTSEPGLWTVSPVFNIAPPPGKLARFGFRVADTSNIVVDAGLSQEPPYHAVAVSRNTPQLVSVFANVTQIWGNPAAEAHDELRGPCGEYLVKFPELDIEAFDFESQGESCEVPRREKPLLTLPTSCSDALSARFEATSWGGARDSGQSQIAKMTKCEKLSLKAGISARPSSRAASSPTGLDFSLRIDDEGLTSNDGRALSHVKKTVVTLPEGMTANPSLADGLETCSESELGRESAGSEPGDGCPRESKIGTIEVQSPLVAETVRGDLFQAEPHANLAGDALIAFYMVIRDRDLGISLKQPVRVDPDPRTGQLIATAEDLPQLPFSSFELRFREGPRSPLIAPPKCGSHEVEAVLTPWAGGKEITETSSFEVISGPGGGPCPSGRPFEPGFQAGSLNNSAGRHSPFAMRLTRRDGDQDLTRFDAILPEGLSARIAGVTRCPEIRIAQARDRDGRDELATPSCPANSRIGSIWAGAGAGSQLTYVPGALYFAGPFAGAPLSAVAIVPAVAGPFDVGTVVTRQALRVHPRTGVVSADGALSEPIPHILAGIPLAVRDIQVSVDRPAFTLNPTSCAPMQTIAGIWGGGAHPFSTADDAPAIRTFPFQAADCARLGFAPRLNLRLKGGTRRGAFPALRAVYRPRQGHANLKRLALRFPRSAFVEQGHFRTICTRVQYAANACPKGSVYGRARAFTPLLDQPLEGPVYLRSSNNNLPDAVFALKGTVDVEAVVRIDSIRGALRATVTEAPDVPVSRVVVNMAGGQRGLFVNSRHLCRSKNRANANLTAHSNRRAKLRPVVRPLACKKGRRGKRGGGRGR